MRQPTPSLSLILFITVLLFAIPPHALTATTSKATTPTVAISSIPRATSSVSPLSIVPSSNGTSPSASNSLSAPLSTSDVVTTGMESPTQSSSIVATYIGIPPPPPTSSEALRLNEGFKLMAMMMVTIMVIGGWGLLF